MTERDLDRTLAELDRLINDPDVSLEPARVWSLLAEVSQHADCLPKPGPRFGRRDLSAAL